MTQPFYKKIFMILKKTLCCFLFVILISNSAIAQVYNFGKEELFYSPGQLKEDADYYFNKVREIHPDPYYYCQLSEYEQKKKDIYDQLTYPMTREEFMWLIAPMNACMDYHSQINISVYNYYICNWVRTIEKKHGKVFPPIYMEENKLYILSNKKHKEIEEINGISITEILTFIKSLYNTNLYAERNYYLMKRFFSPYLDIYFNIRSPYIVKYKNCNKIDIINGINIYEHARPAGLFTLDDYESSYTIYPHSSIGIIHVYNMNKWFSESLSKTLQNFRDSISQYNIKYIFLDLSNNLGGNTRGFELLDVIPHDTIYESRSIIKKEKDGNKKYNIHEVVSFPYSEEKNIKKQLFVLQGINTASNADYLCRIIKTNNMGVLVGENTSESTRTFSYSFQYEMPHTKIKFSVASQFVDYSAHFNDETLSPDIYWKLNYKYGDFEEKELKQIVKQWEKQNKTIQK